jgi:hypothetical protein
MKRNNQFLTTRALCLLALFCGCLPSYADDGIENDTDCQGPVIDVQPEAKPFFSFLNKPHEEISSGLEWLSKRIDIFFADEKLYDESSGSYARLTGSMILREGGTQNYLGDLSVRVELPHTKRRLNLIIETDADENLSNRPGEQAQPTPNDALRATDYFAGVETRLSKESQWDVSTSAGVRVRSPLDPYVRLRMTREVFLDKWKFRFVETLFHFHSSGSGHDATMEWDRAITPRDLFRSHTSATWWDETDDYDLSQSFTMYHQITDRRALSYSISVFGTNKPSIRADTYLLDLRYRQLLHEDWLYYEINPQTIYYKTNGFQAEHSLTLKLEMIFGDQYI